MRELIRNKTMSKRAWKLQEFPAHSSTVNSVSLGHKSGRVLVTGGNDKKVNLWAIGKPNCILSLSGHSTPVDCVRFSINEEQVVGGSSAGALKIWDLESSKLLRTLTGHRSSIRTCDFHPYGAFLASGSADSAIKMWDIRKKGCIFGYKGHDSTVNSLKFSPDGQWIASGGDDKLVKIWDIRVGKVLSEFSEHGSGVTGVEFHPHEFLLASSSLDRTVKFWDLENFSLISSSTPDVPPVKCLSFHPSGSCLFGASSESLRVHGWEPSEIFDFLTPSWNRIQDICISGDQLIGVSTQLTNVSIYVVDLRRVEPVGSRQGLAPSRPPSHTSNSANNTHSLRKSFKLERSDEFENSLNAMKVNEESDLSNTDLEDESYVSQPQVKLPSDFHQVFHPHRDLNRTPPPPDEYLAPTDDEPSSSLSQSTTDPDSPKYELRKKYTDKNSQLNSTQKFKFVSPRRSSVPNLAQKEVFSNVSQFKTDESEEESRSLEESRTKLPAIKLKSSPSENNLNRGKTSVVKPMIQKPPPSNNSSLNIAYYERNSEKNSEFYHGKNEEIEEKIEFVPMSLDKSTGIQIHDFLPKKTGVRGEFGVSILDVDEGSVIQNLLKDHSSLISVLTGRQRNLKLIYNIWHSKDVKTGVETAVDLKDVSAIVDILSVLTLRPSIWNLDLCVTLLPSISQLLQSRYEAHMVAGCSALRLILKNFATVIKTNIESPIQTVGVDISREERYNKSMECYKLLVGIRTFTLKRQTLQGKTGHSFRELHILLSTLD